MAVTALTDLGVPLGGEHRRRGDRLAKERELEAGSAPDRIYRRNVKDSIPLRANSPELFVLARIRDEAHRFANTFHRDRARSRACAPSSTTFPASARRDASACSSTSAACARFARRRSTSSRKAPGMTRKAAQQVLDYFVADTAAEGGRRAPRVEPVYEGDDSDGSVSARFSSRRGAARCGTWSATDG
jgi:excinuclease ABC subunit C